MMFLRPIALVCCAWLAGFTAAPPDIAGDWAGALELGAVRLHLVLHVTRGSDGKLGATMDSVDQNAKGIPIDVITFEGRALHFEMKALGASYDGTLSEDDSTFVGDFSQRGMKLPLHLSRGEGPAEAPPKRPQEPKPPFPYRSEDVSFASPAAGVTLAGTLTLPEGPGPHPCALLVTGSGPQDRDEFLMGHRPFLVLADYLTRRGVAVLRFDDRGVGKSTGDFSAATTKDFTADALAGLEFLKKRTEIDRKRIGLVGHSEGAIVAAMSAAQSGDIAFVVMLAGPGVPMDRLLREQSRLLLQAQGADSAMIALNRRTQARMFAIVRDEPDAKAAQPKLQAALDSLVASLPAADRDKVVAATAGSVTMVNSPWFRYLLSYDPAQTLRRVKAPALALCGERDLQVSPTQNLPPIEKALRDGGNRDVETAVLPGLNHLFQTATTGSVTEYGKIEETMSPLALEKISTWILVRTKLSKR